MSDPIHLRVIGLSTKGWAAGTLAPPLQKEPLASRLQLRAVSTSSIDSAKASAAKYSTDAVKVKAYGSADDIVGDPELEMIGVSVNVKYHLDLAKKVIQTGKRLFLEWPAGVGLHETRILADSAREKHVQSMVGLQARQALLFRKVKAIIDRGDIGDVLSTVMTTRVGQQATIWGAPVYFWGPSVSSYVVHQAVKDKGATMLDIPGGHFLDVFTHILGPIASLSATTAIQFPSARIRDAAGTLTSETMAVTAPNQIAVNGTLQSGAVMSMHWRAGMETPSNVKAVLPFVWVIDGTKGSIRIENDHPMSFLLEIFTPTRLFVDDEEVAIEDDGKTNEGRAWEECVKGKEGGDYPDLEDALKVKEIIDAIWRSAEEGVRVQL